MPRKIVLISLLIIATAVSACNLTQSAALNELALNPPTLQDSMIVVPTPTLRPTRTPIVFAAPTITMLGENAAVTPQPLPISNSPSKPAQSSTVVSPAVPPDDVCSIKTAGIYDVNVRLGPGTEFNIIGVLPTKGYMVVVSRADNGWLQIPLMPTLDGWVSPKVVTLHGPCDDLPTYHMLVPSGNAQSAAQATMTPTPTAVFGSDIGTQGNDIITLVDVDTIVAGTTVHIGSAYFTGSDWMYEIMTVDGRMAVASQSQLTYSISGGTLPFPTATAFIWTATAAVPVMELPTDVSPSDVVIPEDQCTVTVSASTNLYAAPDSAAVVGVMMPGPWAQVGATNGRGWYKVTIWTDGRQGWTTLGSAQLHGPCDGLPVE